MIKFISELFKNRESVVVVDVTGKTHTFKQMIYFSEQENYAVFKSNDDLHHAIAIDKIVSAH